MKIRETNTTSQTVARPQRPTPTTPARESGGDVVGISREALQPSTAGNLPNFGNWLPEGTPPFSQPVAEPPEFPGSGGKPWGTPAFGKPVAEPLEFPGSGGEPWGTPPFGQVPKEPLDIPLSGAPAEPIPGSGGKSEFELPDPKSNFGRPWDPNEKRVSRPLSLEELHKFH